MLAWFGKPLRPQSETDQLPGGAPPEQNRGKVLWFPANRTIVGRAIISLILLFGPAEYLYVSARLTPRWYAGALSPCLGTLVTAGALETLDSDPIS